MKKLFVLSSVTACAVFLLTGCIALQLGGGDKREVQSPSLGQQLIDLKTAQANGALTDAEYQAQKAKLLGK
jgi:hypothetical protein